MLMNRKRYFQYTGTNKLFFMVTVLFICCTLSSCVFYQPMPTEWSSQISVTENCEGFSGYYELAEDYKKQEYNVLERLKNYGGDIEEASEVNIHVVESVIKIEFYANQQLVYTERFDKASLKCTTGKLTLNMENRYSNGTGVDLYEMPKITMYLSKTKDIFVKRKVSVLGMVFLVPLAGSEDEWFKLVRVHNTSPSQTSNNID